MPERNWLIHPVTGSLAAILLILMVAGLVSHANRYHSDIESSHQVGAIEFQDFAPFAEPSGHPKQPTAENRKEAREEADVAAQLRMATAADNALYVGLLTLLLLGLTVFYAHKAWKAAADGAKAAWKSEETARDIGQKQSMAYVHAIAAYTPGQIHGDDELLNALTNFNAKLIVEVENIGNTVAKYVTLDVELAFERSSGGWPKFRELNSPTRIETSNLAPSQRVPIEVFQNLVKAAEIKEDEIDASIAFRNLRGIVTYESVFGEKYRTAFIYFVMFRTHVETAPEEKIEYKAFPFNGPAFERIIDS